MDEHALPASAEPQKRISFQRWRRSLLATLRSDWQGTRLLSYALLLALVGVVIVAAYYLNHPAVDTNDDTNSYLQLAQQIANTGNPASYFRTPGYPVFIDLL